MLFTEERSAAHIGNNIRSYSNLIGHSHMETASVHDANAIVAQIKRSDVCMEIIYKYEYSAVLRVIKQAHLQIETRSARSL